MKKLVGLLIVIISANSFSSTFTCEVDISRVLVYGNGSVNILHSGRGDYTYICDMDGDWKGVSTVTCAMWTSLLQNAQVNDKKVIFYYNGTGSCASLATYGSSPAPVYIGLID